MEGLKVTTQGRGSFDFDEAPSLQPSSSSSTLKTADKLQLAMPASSSSSSSSSLVVMKGFNPCNGVSLTIPVVARNERGDDNDLVSRSRSEQLSMSLKSSPKEEKPLPPSESFEADLSSSAAAGFRSPSDTASGSSPTKFHSTGQCDISDHATPPSTSLSSASSKPFRALEVAATSSATSLATCSAPNSATSSATRAEIPPASDDILTTAFPAALTSFSATSSTVITASSNKISIATNENTLSRTDDPTGPTLRPDREVGAVRPSVDISNSILNPTGSRLEEGGVDRSSTPDDQNFSLGRKDSTSCMDSESRNPKTNQNRPDDEEEDETLSLPMKEGNDDYSSEFKDSTDSNENTQRSSTVDDKSSILSTSSSEFFPADFPSFDPLMTLRLGQFSYSPFSDIFPLSYSSSMARPAAAGAQENGRTGSSSVETVTRCDSRKSSQGGGFLAKLKEALPVGLTPGRRGRHAHIERSTTALILQQRQPGLPSKDPEEEARHRTMYESMVEEVKRKEKKDAKKIEERMKTRLKMEDLTSSALKIWKKELLPCWEDVKSNYQTRQLWWHGIPPSIRGTVWKLVIGNELNITRELYEICLSRFQELLKSSSSPPSSSSTFPSSSTVAAPAVVAVADATSSSRANAGRPLVDGPLSASNCNEVPEKLTNGVGECPVSRESSVELIRLDVSRTFPSLCIFQKEGPYHEHLQGLLGSYVCYRPDVGYVQGMSFVAAILLLNMDVQEAFVCFANLLNRPVFIAFFRLDADLMKAYFDTYNFFFKANLPKLYRHFGNQKLTADLYIIDWVFSLYSKCFNLDIVSRIWDVFFRDGEQFLFRTALGILKLFQPILVNMDFIQMAQFLVRPPESQVDQADLFQSIEGIDMESKGLNFKQALDHFKLNLTTTTTTVPGESC